MTAQNFGGSIYGNPMRSYGDSRVHKRNSLVIGFPPDFEMDNEDLWAYMAQLVQRNSVFVLVGWERLYSMPEEAMMLEFDDTLHWTCDTSVLRLIEQAVVVSKKSVVLILAEGNTAQDLIPVLEQYNAEHVHEGFSILRDSCGRKIRQRGQLRMSRPRVGPAP